MWYVLSPCVGSMAVTVCNLAAGEGNVFPESTACIDQGLTPSAAPEWHGQYTGPLSRLPSQADVLDKRASWWKQVPKSEQWNGSPRLCWILWMLRHISREMDYGPSELYGLSELYFVAICYYLVNSGSPIYLRYSLGAGRDDRDLKETHYHSF